MSDAAPPRHLLDLTALGAADLRAILNQARRRKQARAGMPKGASDPDRPCDGRVLAMIFQKNSTRTRVSFDVAMRQLGGSALVMSANDMQLGRGETVEDTARVLSCMVDAVMIRANRHEDIEGFASAADVPVLNGLSDRSHPCQILADLLTIEERLGDVRGKTIAWVGDGNNVLTSFLHAAPVLGYALRIATPPNYAPRTQDVHAARASGARVDVGADPGAAVAGADVVVTDTWVSMGDPDKDERMQAFPPFAVDAELMQRAAPHAMFMHCLPAHRGEEVSADVMDGAQSAVWDEAENRLHAQKAALMWCFRLL
ncbi:MAG: ornithine carbamoyltransferase [Alphaproteobacteria bacterium]|nr:ornithine carbamoyltransferase [Alphaproteobacteria bacterium]